MLNLNHEKIIVLDGDISSRTDDEWTGGDDNSSESYIFNEDINDDDHNEPSVLSMDGGDDEEGYLHENRELFPELTKRDVTPSFAAFSAEETGRQW